MRWVFAFVFLAPTQAATPAVTFSRDVAPILYKRCITCHRDGEVAPFPLITYEDAAKRARQIARVTASRLMPPWKPVPGHGDFEGARSLSASEIETLRRWAATGAARGGTPPPVPPPASTGIATPDLIARMPAPFTVSADGPDTYRCFVIPLSLDTTKYVDAIDFRPGNPRVVHHALFFVDRARSAREPDYSCFGAPGFLPVGGLGGWSPGSPPIRMPEGAAAVLNKGSQLVVQLHFHPTGKPETVQAEIAFSFTAQVPRRRLMDIPLGSQLIDIPAGAKAYKVRDHFTLSVDVDAVGIIPHAHYICKEMRGVARLPDGSTRSLIWIRDWDFNWQEHYKYRRPVHLPAGTRLEMEFTYDNSAANPRNPNSPPQRVQYGPGSADEMAGLHVQVFASRESDVEELAQDLWGKMMRSVGGGFFNRPAEKR